MEDKNVPRGTLGFILSCVQCILGLNCSDAPLVRGGNVPRGTFKSPFEYTLKGAFMSLFNVLIEPF